MFCLCVFRDNQIRKRMAPAPESNIEEMSLDDLRRALRANRVTFPSQAPTFLKHDRPDLQWKFAQFYFVLGWSCRAIADRHGLIRQRVQQILNTWKQRAVQTGYIQFIPPIEALDPPVTSRRVIPPKFYSAPASPR